MSDIERIFLEEVTRLPEGGVLILRVADQTRENYAMSIHHDTLDHFSGFLNQAGKDVAACCVSLLARPGATLFWMVLEHTWFDPTGPDEKLYLCAWTKWQDQIWVIGVIPAQLTWTFEEAAKRTGMLLASGAPMAIDSQGPHYFPIPWARTLENSDPDAPHYRATAEGIRLLADGTISTKELMRRVTRAERAMWRYEYQAIRDLYRAKGIRDPEDS